MRFLVLLVAWSLVSRTATSQNTTNNFQYQCGFDEKHHHKIQESSEYKDLVRSFEKSWKSHSSNHHKIQYTLPVVVHIIHNNGLENIDDQQVERAITYLNDAFSNRGYYNPQTGVDTEIEFCLAQRTPGNTATNGITRTISSLTNLDKDTEDQQVKDLIRWDPTNYINIWVVNEICGSTGCGVAGYAYFPTAHGLSFDGIVVEAQFMGSTEANTSVLVHELGHYLGLYHTFQGGCLNDDCKSEGDRVCDTPPDQTTVRTICIDQMNSCETDENDTSTDNPFRSISSGGLGEQNDQFQNYMDYSNLECYDRFTSGQKDRMVFAIEEVRHSLTHSTACLSPCLAVVSSQISANATSFLVGETIQLEATVNNATSYVWTIDNVLFSNDLSTDYTFSDAGIYQIIFEASSDDPKCFPSLDTIVVNVVCPANVDLEYNLTGNQISLTNLSTNFNSIEWTIREQNGPVLANSTDPNFSYSFSASGWYEICLSAITDLCSSDSCFFVRIYAEENEICGNGIDDDGDGWVDYFDEDCPERDTLFMAQPHVECNSAWPIQDFSMKLKWKSTENIPLWFSANLRSGDIDSDGKVEVVTQYGRSVFDIAVFDGETGQLKQSIILPGDGTGNNFCMADVDNDGEVEFFYLSYERDMNTYIYCAKLSGTFVWRQIIEPQSSTNQTFGTINVADFNEDGIPEVYYGAQILNALNGALLVHGRQGSGKSQISNLTIAADLLPATPGLELAAGNTVYQINITNINGTNGNTITPVVVSGNMPDGYTSAADFNNDGLLEVVVVEGTGWGGIGSNKLVYVWDPRTRTVIAQSTQDVTKVSLPFIGDMDGDCIPEIGVAYGKESIFSDRGELVLLSYNNTSSLEVLYRLETSDGSGSSGMSAFDFNQDGLQELVYRDQTSLRVIDCKAGEILAERTVHNATGFDVPIVADIDDDNQAEILVTGGIDTINYDYTQNIIYVYEAADIPWSPARSVWNQVAYHVTNVNDDLTIPVHQQNPATQREDYCDCPNVYNNFMTQSTYRTRKGCPINPAFDARLEVLNTSCDPDFIIIEYQLHNLADKKSIPDSLVIGVYDGNPLIGSASIVAYDTINIQIDPGKTSTILTIRIPLGSFQGKLFLLANVIEGLSPIFSLPITSLFECDYENNLDSLTFSNDPLFVDLGPDITICSNQAIPLEVPPGFSSYRWNDGTTESIYTAYEPGIHWVEVYNVCGQSVRDSIEIFIDPITQVEILADSLYCRGDTIDLRTNELFDSYQWFGLNPPYCDDCPEQTIVAEEGLHLTLRVGNSNGCFSSDTLSIAIRDTSLIFEQRFLCPGDSTLVEGAWIKDEGTYLFTLDSSSNCDSTLMIELVFEEVATPFELGQDTTLCSSDSLFLSVPNNYEEYTWQNGSKQPFLYANEPGIYWLNVTDQCDFSYSDTIRVDYADTLLTHQFYTICEGDSIFLENRWLKTPGSYRYNYNSSLACDSAVIIQLGYDTLDYQFNYELFCDPPRIDFSIIPNDSISVIWEDGQGGFHRSFNEGGEIVLKIESEVSSCREDLEISLPYLPDISSIPNSFDTTYLSGSQLALDLNLDENLWTINWIPEEAVSCPTCSSVLVEEGYSDQLIVQLQHIESGCSFELKINLNSKDGIFIPNTFSPNEDGHNDIWQIHFNSGVEKIISVSVFNRWGDQVLDWQGDDEFSWDGNFNGRRAEQGVYAYYIQFMSDNGSIISKKGGLTLLR